MRKGGKEGRRERSVRYIYRGTDEMKHANEEDGEHEEAAHEEGALGLGGGGGG